MCNFAYDVKKVIDKDWDRSDPEFNNDRCPECSLHWCMCECNKRNTRNNNVVDICGPDYPPC